MTFAARICVREFGGGHRTQLTLAGVPPVLVQRIHKSARQRPQ